MNRLIIGAAVAAAVAAGGGAWWMASQRAGPAAAAIVEPAAPVAGIVDEEPAADQNEVVAAGAANEPVEGPVQGKFTLERGVCFGPCPVYSATVTGDDHLVFEGRKFTARSGRHERDLAKGSFERLLAIASRYDFAALDSNWPDDKGLNCPEPPTDMATTSVSIEGGRISHTVKFYEGCAGYTGAERVIAMMKEFDAVLALHDWIGPREAFYGKRTP